MLDWLLNQKPWMNKKLQEKQEGKKISKAKFSLATTKEKENQRKSCSDTM